MDLLNANIVRNPNGVCQIEIWMTSKLLCGSVTAKEGYRRINLKWPFDLGEMALPIEIWAFILTYLIPLDLLHLSICSKRFCSMVHQNKKFKRRFEHLKKLVCGVSFHDQFRYEFERFSTALTFVLQKFFNQWHWVLFSI